ncbi:MAG: proline--tRNA ligase [Betaproteobacteria bacterium]|nr:proline--tRNA ligase [Betaproteobacteria bacterium]
MRLRKAYIPTLKEAPADAEVISHKLLVRAGFLRKLTSGVYIYLPLAWRSLNKIANIVREEMDRAGAQELHMPMVQPSDLWQESGRWDFYGKELLRFKDRHDRDCCLGPTHEEVITDLIRGEVRSYRQLPLNLYQIQTKFRDEIRPRFGLLRGREFIMKDAYSFDCDDEGADVSYRSMYDAYWRIFSRLGLRFRAVEADSGSIGGSFSHEFMVLAETGEDMIVSCTSCSFAANVERAPVVWRGESCRQQCPPVELTATPGAHSVAQVCDFLGVQPQQLIKTVIFAVDGNPVAVLVRGDREVNPVKLKNLLNAGELAIAAPEQVREWTGAPVGFAGPQGLHAVMHVYADLELRGGTDWIAGANRGDMHVLHLNLTRDATVTAFADLRVIGAADPCPLCGAEIETARGIEVGHVFKLGTKYSKALNAVILDEQGRERHIIMGCYGIGVSRVLAACIEQNNDADGIIFPPPIAPYDVALLNLDTQNADLCAKAEELYAILQTQGLDVLLDDREERPGIKFKDADLIGLPVQLVLGGRGFGRGMIEAKDRRSGEKAELPLEGFAAAFATWREHVLQGWK